jgi:hypothetical protein
MTTNGPVLAFGLVGPPEPPAAADDPDARLDERPPGTRG